MIVHVRWFTGDVRSVISRRGQRGVRREGVLKATSKGRETEQAPKNACPVRAPPPARYNQPHGTAVRNCTEEGLKTVRNPLESCTGREPVGETRTAEVLAEW